MEKRCGTERQRSLLLCRMCRATGTNKQAVTHSCDGLGGGDFYAVVLIRFLNKHVRQGREAEAGKQKHNDAKNRIWISGLHTCFRVRLGFWVSCEGPVTLWLSVFRLVSKGNTHLLVPSENMSRRGKKLLNLSRRLRGTIAQIARVAEGYSES